jgi:hypothetical protein
MKKISLGKSPAGQAAAPVAAPTELRTLWTTMPGWCTAADLTPPELINSRRLTVLRKQMVVGVVVLLGICAGGYYLASRDNGAAADQLVAAQNRTLQLQQAGRSYAGVVQIQGSVTLVQTQIATVMGGDVDLVALMGQLESNLPKTMTIGQESIVISPAGVAAGAGSAAGAGLDTSGLPRIGSITLSGTGKTLDDLSDYVDRLHTIPGLVDVVPISNTKSTGGAGTQYNVQIGLTNALLSHRFDVAPVTK